MKRWLLALGFIVCMVVPAHAASVSVLETDYAQGGSSTKTYSITGSGQVFTGPCRILAVNFFSATAGKIVGVYNTVDSRYPITDLEFELGISANNINAPYYPNAFFLNGIRVLSTDASSITNFVFDY